jgi:hypothetical protein
MPFAAAVNQFRSQQDIHHEIENVDSVSPEDQNRGADDRQERRRTNSQATTAFGPLCGSQARPDLLAIGLVGRAEEANTPWC